MGYDEKSEPFAPTFRPSRYAFDIELYTVFPNGKMAFPTGETVTKKARQICSVNYYKNT